MKKQLLVNRHYFLARFLSLDKRTIVDGLKRKYPKAILPLPKAVILTEQTLIDEYYLKLAYALLESSKDNKNLAHEIVAQIRKKALSTCTWVESKKRGRLLYVSDIYECLELEEESYLTLDHFFNLSVIEYMCEYLEIKIEVDEELTLLHQSEQQFFESMYPVVVSTLREELYHKQGKLYKEMETFLTRYMKWLNVSTSTFSNYTENAKRHGLTNCMLEQLLPKHRMNQSELILVMALANIECDQSLTCEWVFENWLDVLLCYVMFKRHEENVKQLFAYYPFQEKLVHKMLSESIRTESARAKKAEDENQKLKMNMLSIKEQTEKKKDKKIHELGYRLDKSMQMQTHQKTKIEELELRLQQLQEKSIQTQMHQKTKIEELELCLQQLKEKYQALNRQATKSQSPVISHHEPLEEYKLDIEILAQLNTSTTLIAGGHPKTVRRLQDILPNCKYVAADDKKRDDFFKGVEQSILLTTQLGHDMSRRIKKLCPNSPQFSIESTNEGIILNKMAQYYKQQKSKNK